MQVDLVHILDGCKNMGFVLSDVFSQPNIIHIIISAIIILGIPGAIAYGIFSYIGLNEMINRKFWRNFGGDRDYLKAFEKYLLKYDIASKKIVEPCMVRKERKVKPLDPLLVTIDSRERKTNPAYETKPIDNRTKTRRVKKLIKEAMTEKQLVLLGDPGSGKTVCLIQLAKDFISRGLTSPSKKPLRISINHLFVILQSFMSIFLVIYVLFASIVIH